MDLGRYVLGLLVTGAFIGPVLLGAHRLRVRALFGLVGSSAWVAEAVLALGLLVIAVELVGVLSLLTALGLVLAGVCAGAAAWLIAGRIDVPEHPEPISAPGQSASAPGRSASAPGRSGARPELSVAMVGLAAVGAAWIGWTIFAYRHGMETVDTVWYHLPAAARFVQEHSILHLQYFDSGAVTAFYPANAELIHAVGLLAFGSDLLSPAINLAWVALALVASWAIGQRFDRGPHCVLAVTLLLGTPALVDTQPGGAYNDIACVALLLSAAAVLVAGGVRVRVSAVAAVAAGLAIGTKFTMIVPALALGVAAVVVSKPGTRLRQVVTWAAGLILLGGYWYLRNAILVGNPLPSLAVHLGPLSLPAPHVGTPSFTVAQYLFTAHIWSAFYIPGLRQALGPAWWAILILAAVGTLTALFDSSDPARRILGAVTAVSAVAFLFTPQFLGLPGAPVFFVDNVRYAAGPLALGLVLLPTARVFSDRRRARWLLALVSVALVVTELDPGVWPTGLDLKPFVNPLHGASALAGVLLAGLLLLVGLGILWRPRDGRSGVGWVRTLRPVVTVTGGAGLALALGAAGWGVAHSYSRVRYASSPPLPTIYRWARTVHHTRIGIVGFVEQYPLYGAGGSNYVQYLGVPQAHRGYGSITDCSAWRRAVNEGRYRWVVIAPSGFQFGFLTVAPELRWTAASHAATLVIREHPTGSVPGEQADLFRINGRLDPATCPASGAHGGGTSAPLGLA